MADPTRTNLPALRWPLTALPRIHTAGRYPLDDRGFRFHYRHTTIALHLHDYAGRVRIGRDLYDLRPGTLTLSPPHTPSRYDLPRPGHHLCIHFFPPARAAGPVARLPLCLPLGAWSDFATNRLTWICRLHHESKDVSGGGGGRVAAAAASAALLELLLWLATRGGTPAAGAGSPGAAPAPRGSRAVERAAEWLEENLDQPLHVPTLARHVGLSQNYLARLFRGRFAATIPRYLLTRRVERARHLLTVTDIPVRLIAARVGLPDPQHFNKAFRRLTGMSPTAARAVGQTKPTTPSRRVARRDWKPTR